MLTRNEVRRVLARLDGTHRLLGALLYGSGMRIMEALRLRVKDVEFERREIVVRDDKGAKDRMTMLPRRIVARLRTQLIDVRTVSPTVSAPYTCRVRSRAPPVSVTSV